MRLLLACALALIAVPAAAQSNQQKSEWEQELERRDWKEDEVKLPAFPKTEGLIEFTVVDARFRFFIDPASLAVGPDGVVRYTLVARSPSGVANISYEGIRCAEGIYKVFALGNDARWTERDSGWRRIESRSMQPWQHVLQANYFCPNRRSIETSAEGLDALRRRGHPAVSITRYKD